MRKPVIDFVVSARNNRQLIAVTLEAIGQQTLREFTCTLVDGLSTDGTPEFVRERFPWVKVIVKDADTGPTHSRNLGYEAGSAEFVAFLDSDVTLEPGWAEAQINLMRAEPRIGIAGGKLLYSQIPELLYSAYGVMSRYGIAWDGGRAEAAVNYTQVRRCLWLNSSALVARREMLALIGAFDEAMFLGSEDSDLGWRANIAGWQAAFNPHAVATHEMHGTLDPEAIGKHVLYLVWRNRLRSSLVNYEWWNVIRYCSLFTLLCAIDCVLRSPRKEKVAALWWNLTHLRETLKRRTWVQKRRQVKDRELWPLFQYGFRGPGHGFFPRGSSQPEAPDSNRERRSSTLASAITPEGD